ncbi:phenylalanine-4-hydroxylase, monomeric form [Chitinophaga eiseniae]|uniref:Phenylalanine-4-hydroxylase, monomeric form n=1 Tax=Chitinophaga eiseniae TaxID=634771 RepID=A0A1T4TWI3_9BACT|nr:aminotransferase class I/II-fold pyridoxal phosphate-dependent enzyme [Chitinophaga eiseniae]SKA44805.1 phenylalanine-4-hydroxylase, monomeric form [Chitinophaga eiseniae]
MSSPFVTQDDSLYQEADHHTWSQLFQKQNQLGNEHLASAYLEGYEKLRLDDRRIVRIEDISRRLEAISGWTLVPVSGLIPTRDFFYMLINKKYPVTVYIRQPHELDFSEQPDIFHDVYGHLPLLTNEKFTRFLTSYSIIALKYVNNDRAVDFLGRLYWFTYEMGLIMENGESKAYGGAIITSSEERANIASGAAPVYPFSLDQVMNTPYNPYKLQQQYFVINSFDELFNVIEGLEEKLIDHLLLPEQDNVVRNFSLNDHIGREFNDVIGFLNDTQFKYPDAVSFVAGQPDERFFDIEDHIASFDTYVRYRMEKTGGSRNEVINRIGQYGKTKGFINDLVAEYLKVEEDIKVTGEDILMTVGAQEAFGIVVGTLCQQEKDVVLVEDPGYIGVSAFAKVFNYNIAGVGTDEEGIDLKLLRDKILTINGSGKRVKLLYVIPDYQNPSGSCMPIGNRLKLLEMAQQYNFLILEDSVYNSFTYAQKKNPTLKSLDRYGRVLYVGSFSKSLFPGLRMGMIVGGQRVENHRGDRVSLIDEMTKVKAQMTNNTSGITQAMLGGVLLAKNFRLSEWNRSKFESYKMKRDHMLASLDKYFNPQEHDWAAGIRWTRPEGGFFIKMSMPFEVDDQSVVDSASRFNVIFSPMRYFYLKGGGENEIRLTFSNLSRDMIEKGVKQLAQFVRWNVTGIKGPLPLTADTTI